MKCAKKTHLRVNNKNPHHVIQIMLRINVQVPYDSTQNGKSQDGVVGQLRSETRDRFCPVLTYRSISATSNLQMASTKTTFHCAGVILLLSERTKISKGFTLTIVVTIKGTKYTQLYTNPPTYKSCHCFMFLRGSSSQLHQVCEPLRLESMPWNWLLIKVFQRDQLPNREAGNPLGEKWKTISIRKSMGRVVQVS